MMMMTKQKKTTEEMQALIQSGWEQQQSAIEADLKSFLQSLYEEAVTAYEQSMSDDEIPTSADELLKIGENQSVYDDEIGDVLYSYAPHCPDDVDEASWQECLHQYLWFRSEWHSDYVNDFPVDVWEEIVREDV